MEAPDFWNDPEVSQNKMKNLKSLKDVWLWLCETQENPISWDYVKNLKSIMKKQLFSEK